MESYDPTKDGEIQHEETTQYLSDEETKLVDAFELTEDDDLIIGKFNQTDQNFSKSKSVGAKKVNQDLDENPENNEDDIREKNHSKKERKSKPVPSKYNSEITNAPKYKIKLSPTPDLYLEKSTEIPKHLTEPKYLSNNFFEKVILTSYPRSGNTLLRKYLEDITGIITGSDWDVRRKLNSDLVEMGMKGEGKVNNRVWTVKSHYPERYGHTKFFANKCILLVRNPMDAIISLYNMIATGTHNWSMTDEDFEQYNSYFDMFISQEIAVWRDFHSYWIDPEPMIPTFIVRYEDLISDPKNTLLDLFRFLLNK